MSLLERLLIPIFIVVAVGATLLEGASPEGVRRIALVLGALLALVLTAGFVVRYVRRKPKADEKGPEEER